MSNRKNPMKPSDASRIQSTQAKSGNPTGANTFPSRAQAAAANNVNRGVVNPNGGATSGTTRTSSPRTTTSRTTPASTTGTGKATGGTSRK